MSALARRLAPSHRPYLGRSGWNLGLVALIVVVGIAGTATSNQFLGVAQLAEAAQSTVATGLLAVGLSVVVLVGEIDISLTSNLALVTVLIGLLGNAHDGALLIVVVAVGAGVLLGLVNGVLVAVFEMPSLAITLGTLGAYQGIAYVIAGSTSYTTFPSAVTALGANFIGDIPFSLIVLAIFAVALAALLALTFTGRALYGVGRAPAAVRRNGLSVPGKKLLAFGIGGLSAGLAALVYVGYYGSGGGDSASGSLLSAVTPVALGGFDIYGGSGRISGVVLAWVLLTLLQDLMGLLNVSTPVQSVVVGALLLASMAVGYARSPRSARRLASYLSRSTSKGDT